MCIRDRYGNCPYQCTQNISNAIMKNYETYRSIAACNHNENHHMIYFAETPVYFFSRIYGVIDGTGCIKQDHSQYKNAQCNNVNHIIGTSSFDNKGNCPGYSQ